MQFFTPRTLYLATEFPSAFHREGYPALASISVAWGPTATAAAVETGRYPGNYSTIRYYERGGEKAVEDDIFARSNPVCCLLPIRSVIFL